MNNVYSDCPALMSDGRLVTSYAPRCLGEYSLTDQHGRPLSSYAYRQYLISNGEALIAKQQEAIRKAGECAGCSHYPYSYPPAQRTQSCDGHACQISAPAPGGLGLERRGDPQSG